MPALIMSLYFLEHSEMEGIIEDGSFLLGEFHYTTIPVTYSRLFLCLLMPFQRILLSCLLWHFPLKLYSSLDRFPSTPLGKAPQELFRKTLW